MRSPGNTGSAATYIESITSAYLAAVGHRFGVLVGVISSPPRSQKGRQDRETLNLLYLRQRSAAQVRYPAAMLAYMTAGLGWAYMPA